MIRAVPAVAGMDSYTLAELGGTDSVSLAQNESAYPASPMALAAGREALAQSAQYPDPDWRELRTAVAEVHPEVADHSVLFGAGSMELIGCLIRAFAGPGHTVLGSRYGYLFVGTAALQAGAAYETAPEPDFTVSVDALLDAVTPSTRIVFVCNPGNPTGTRIKNAELVKLRNALPDDVMLVVDQAYAEFDDQDHRPVFALVSRGDTVVTRTLSKAYGLAGARVGWGIFPQAIATQVRKLLNPNNVSLVSQAMAAAALRDQNHVADIVDRTARQRDATCERLRAAGYTIPDSATNFLLIKFATESKAAAADAELRSAGLLLRGMKGYGLPDCLRATVGPAEALERMTEILEKLA